MAAWTVMIYLHFINPNSLYFSTIPIIFYKNCNSLNLIIINKKTFFIYNNFIHLTFSNFNSITFSFVMLYKHFGVLVPSETIP